MSFFISRLYIRGLSSVKKDDIPFFSTQKPTQSTTEPEILKYLGLDMGTIIKVITDLFLCTLDEEGNICSEITGELVLDIS